MRGFIRQRGTTWTAYWSTTDRATGRRVQHTKGGFVRKEPGRPPKGDSAREYLNSIVGSVQEGSWRKDQAFTVRQLLEDHWLPAQRSRALRPATLDQQEGVAKAWIYPYLGATRVAALTPKTMVEFVETLRTTKSAGGRPGLSPRSAQLAVSTLKAATRYAVEAGLLGRDPIASVRPPRPSTPEMKFWTADEARAFLAHTADDRLSWAWALLLTRGPRRGEVCGMKWSDVDLDAGAWRVSRTRVLVDGRAVESGPKTRAGRRAVPLDALLVALLRKYRARQAAEKLAAGGAYCDDGWLFANELGEPYHPDTLSEWFDDKLTAAKLPRIRLHDTRHTAASLMLASGVPVKVVSEILGHASPTITLGIYAHVMPGMAEEAGAALSASLLS